MVKNGKETGLAKYAQYKEHKERFKRAIEAGCYLECIFIDYAMMEDRLLSILHHLNIADRERGDGRGWAQSPKPKREGYRSALQSMTKIRKDGSVALPKLDNISTRIEVLRTLASFDEPNDGCNDFEHWLRTDVRNKLTECEVVELCDCIAHWIKRRNDLVHALFGARARGYDPQQLESLAKEGMDLAGKLDNISGRMKTAMAGYERKRLKQAKRQSNKRR